MSRAARILVTGASRGIGRAVAASLLAEGRRVALLARDEARLAEVAETAPDRAAVLVADLADEAAPHARLIEAAARALGGLDGLVHAAGVAPHAPLAGIHEAHLRVAQALHVRAPLMLTQALAARLRAEEAPGSVVFLASTLGVRPAPGTLVYAATKAALINLTRGLALELAPDGVRVNAVAPGVVDTDMVRAPRLAPGEPAPEGETRERLVAAQLEALRSLHPLGRLGTPEEVAEAVRYLLDAAWATGSVLTLDGGLSAG
ncbi:MAG TPA: SDR family oxidoreductase [Sandaracinaceae bacterium LLY-WYZ-13_1]|nr:SDR family oxidoreductase [Sandaracinaceae bacterium LLY-WYZ-13_1]